MQPEELTLASQSRQFPAESNQRNKHNHKNKANYLAQTKPVEDKQLMKGKPTGEKSNSAS